MAKLIYSAITSLDGYIEDDEGKFDDRGGHAQRLRWDADSP
jgi:hypothetical protein